MRKRRRSRQPSRPGRATTRPTVIGPSPPVVTTAHNAGDLIGITPYLLGFHPEESLVLMLISGTRIVVTVRFDLTDADDLPAFKKVLVGIADSQPTTAAMLIAYTGHEELARKVLLAGVTALNRYDIVDAVQADGQRWFSFHCSDPRCCPPEGRPYDVDSSRMAAEAVYAGLTAVGTRADLVASVQGPPAEKRPALIAATEFARREVARASVRRRMRMMGDIVQRQIDAPTDLTDAECLGLAALANDLDVRDVAWAMMTTDTAEAHVRLWRQVVQCAVEPLEQAPLCLLGMAAWISGNGALQVCCIERMAVVDPTYSMAKLLSDINRRALPPYMWNEVGPEILEELDAG